MSSCSMPTRNGDHRGSSLSFHWLLCVLLSHHTQCVWANEVNAACENRRIVHGLAKVLTPEDPGARAGVDLFFPPMDEPAMGNWVNPLSRYGIQVRSPQSYGSSVSLIITY